MGRTAHEDDGTETSTASRRHEETSKDSTKTRALIPTPLDLSSTDSSNTDTSNGGDETVGGRNVGAVTSAPHDPERSTGSGTGEGEKLDTGVALESLDGDDTALDGGGCTGSDCEGAGHFEDETADHGPAVGD